MAVTFKSKPSEFDGHLSGGKTPASIANSLTVKQATASVNVTTTKTLPGGEKVEQTLVDTQKTIHKGITAPADQLCSVTVGGGLTIPTEPYANVKIMVSVTVPCNGKAALNDTYEFATDWVSDKLEEAVKKIKGE